MNYQEAVAYISSLAPRGWRLGLDRMTEFARQANLTGSIGDGKGPKFIHVAGTNGKGSTTAFLQSMMCEHGVATGSFFSPYVVEPRERVQFNREFISEADLAEITTDLIRVVDQLADTEFGGITEFEFKTAIGFEFWKRKQCEWVALEVGLGGRLDATNIVTPAAGAIVSIGRDHMHILGDSLSEIAFEKAGILKPGIPAVIGRMADEPLNKIREVAAGVGAPLLEMGRDVTFERTGSVVRVTTPHSQIDLEPSLFGEVQAHNVAVAYAALEASGFKIDPAAAQRGAATASIPGRFMRIEHQGKTIVLDGAHNQDSAVVLAKQLQEAGYANVACVTGMLQGHLAAEFYPEFAQFVNRFYVTPVDFHRTQAPEAVCEALTDLNLKAEWFKNKEAALGAALGDPESKIVLVTGSFYLVGEITRLLQQ